MNTETQSWDSFFADYRKHSIQNISQTWSSFFKDFSRFRPKAPQEASFADTEAAAVFFERFDQFYTPFVKAGGGINVWEVAKVKYDEVRNCAVLAWLLNCHGTHGQGNFFLKALLGAVEDLGYMREFIEKSYTVTVEQSHDILEGGDESQSEPGEGNLKPKKQRNRVDFVIKNDDMLIFIEAKIYLGEGDQQLKRYIDLLNREAGKRRKALLFLTTTAYLPEDCKKLNPKPLPLSWATIANCFEQAIKQAVSPDVYGTMNQPFWANVAQQFCWHIRRF